MKFYINETADDGYCPFRVLLDDTKELNTIADNIQKAKGKLPLFNYGDGEECDDDSWYNFYLICNRNGVDTLEFEYGDRMEYCDTIPLTEEDKKNAFDAVLKFFGGVDGYKQYIDEYEKQF